MAGTKHCCYVPRISDSTYYDRPGMKGGFFIPLSKPITRKEKSERWMRACGRAPDDFNTGKISW